MKITLHNNLIHLANFCPNTLMSIQNRHQESDFVLLKYIIYSNVILLNFKDYTLRTIEFNLIYEVRMIGILFQNAIDIFTGSSNFMYQIFGLSKIS
ncbi:MAG: hypothetical protein IPN49_17560 [Saprospiraceae bacterium]|nr:hypothetical protein [Saprospiraceae bacterium]